MEISNELQQRIKDRIRKYPDRSDSQIRELFKRKNGERNPIASAAVVGEVRLEMGTAGVVRPDKREHGRSLDDFRKTYDKDTIVPGKIRAALEELGGESWEYESEFVRRAGVSYADLGNYRSMFEDHVVTARKDSKRVWAGSPEFAAVLREMV